MNIVARTSMAVKFTETTASKKKSYNIVVESSNSNMIYHLKVVCRQCYYIKEKGWNISS